MPLNLRPPSGRSRAALLVAASAVIALGFAILSVFKVSLLPPKLERRDLQTAGGVAHTLVDFKRTRITDREVTWEYFNALRTRTVLLGRLMASASALEHIGDRAGIPADQIAAVAPVTISVSGALTEPGSEQRAREVLLESKPYGLEIQARSNGPVLDIYSQAPSVPEAERLADAATSGLRDYLRELATQEGADPERQLRLTPLGSTQATPLTSDADLKVAALTFLVAFALAYGALRAAVALRARARRAGAVPRPWPETPGAGAAPGQTANVTTAAPLPRTVSLPWATPVPSPSGAVALRSEPLSVRLGGHFSRDGDWPRTTRVLPWLVAIFLVVLWLVPFDSIELAVSLPVDLKFDRLVLPFVAAAWLAALAAGGRDAPRLGLTWMHGAVAAFVVIACLSVILEASSLTRSLELDTSVKKLPLLMAYLSLFVMMASIVRREEVGAFLKFTLVLAVICGLGMIWEYRQVDNVFFDWADKLLPGFFEVDSAQVGYDSAGRRVTHGPAAHGLVAVAMLAMALPIAVLGMLQPGRTRDRILYALAACVLMGAVLATQRKTGILAPVAGVLTLAYFRRRELLKLAPLGVALLVVLLLVSPATVASVTDQFKPDRLQADTVNDRASDYDAIRPDVWSHVALGRGYGSYQPVGHRILDSEILVRTVEMGVIGLTAFLLLGVAVIASARRTINSGSPEWAGPALAGAAAAVVFLVVATLFDTMSFPQVPYIFLCFAALVAVLVRREA